MKAPKIIQKIVDKSKDPKPTKETSLPGKYLGRL